FGPAAGKLGGRAEDGLLGLCGAELKTQGVNREELAKQGVTPQAIVPVPITSVGKNAQPIAGMAELCDHGLHAVDRRENVVAGKRKRLVVGLRAGLTAEGFVGPAAVDFSD